MSSELLLGKDTPFSFFTIYRLYSRAQETGPQALEMSGNRSTLCFLKQCFRPVACLGEKEGSGLRNKKKQEGVFLSRVHADRPQLQIFKNV